jgi:hypothetical protein
MRAGVLWLALKVLLLVILLKLVELGGGDKRPFAPSEEVADGD